MMEKEDDSRRDFAADKDSGSGCSAGDNVGVSVRPDLTSTPIGELVERLRARADEPHPDPRAAHLEKYDDALLREAADALEDLRLGIQCAKARNKQLAESNAVLLENGREDQETIVALSAENERYAKAHQQMQQTLDRAFADKERLRAALEKAVDRMLGSHKWDTHSQIIQELRSALEGWETVKPGEWPLEDVKPLTGEEGQ